MNASTSDTRSATIADRPAARQLRRSADDKMLAGVAGGVARYLDADVTLVRVIIAALALFTGAGVAPTSPPGCSSPRRAQRPPSRAIS